MILFSNCKINIGLNIVSKRSDRYHNIETIMYPVRGLCDAIEITRAETDGITFTASGIDVGADANSNLCVKAYNALSTHKKLGGVNIHLHKAIPFGAGLGGGSANAAYTIKGLNQLFELELSVSQMESIAAEIGSDTAFFITSQPAIATSRGEILTPIQLSTDLIGHRLVIIKPNISVSTALAYSSVKPTPPTMSLVDSVKRPIAEWKGLIKNQFEESVFTIHPSLMRLKNDMYDQGAIYCAMSGSGSAIYAIFDKKTEYKTTNNNLFVYQEII